MSGFFDLIVSAIDLGGPVIAILMLSSVAVLAVVLFKTWQFASVRVGRHGKLAEAVAALDRRDNKAALEALELSNSYLVVLVEMAMAQVQADRLRAEIDSRLSKLERGFRFLDTVVQLAPLLGLFGTVLGMIEAFQALQDAGSVVDPSLLAGGIWTALFTTAAGLVVAMPSAVALSWLESRVEADRAFADHAIATILNPTARVPTSEQTANNLLDNA